MSFTIVNIHIPAKITEGGTLGLTLLLYKVFGLDPAILNPLFDLICFAIGFSLFGRLFIKRTLFASIVFATTYKLFLWTGPILPTLYNYPLIAAIVGGIGIGVGCGLVIAQGGASGGDDALALVISKKMKIGISKAYLGADIVILLLSLIYIPFGRIFFSLITTTISSVLVGQFEVNIKTPTAKKQSVHI